MYDHIFIYEFSVCRKSSIMPLIEGVGDEVTQFFVVVMCGLVALLAWWSTGKTTRASPAMSAFVKWKFL